MESYRFYGCSWNLVEFVDSESQDTRSENMWACSNHKDGDLPPICEDLGWQAPILQVWRLGCLDAGRIGVHWKWVAARCEVVLAEIPTRSTLQEVGGLVAAGVGERL